MILSRADLLATLYGAGVPVGVPTSPDEISGNLFATVSRDWVASVWDAFVENLSVNLPRLVEIRPNPSGGIGRKVPRYVLNGFCCRGHALGAYAQGMLGFARQAGNSAVPLDHDALAFGFLHYTAEARPDNFGRAGRHEQLWGVDHSGTFFTFEDGDGLFEPLTPGELATVTLIFAQ